MLSLCSALAETPLHALPHLIFNKLYGIDITIPI